MSDLPALGVRFDINRIDSGSYGIACWRIFWEVVDPKDIGGSILYEGDTAASINGRENVFCIAIQNTSSGPLGAIKAALANHAMFTAVCAPPRFVEGAECAREPLVKAGTITASGEILGDAWNSKPALEEVRRKR